MRLAKMGDGERETWTPHMINRHYMQTIIASSASLPLRAEARLVAPVPLRALVHDLAVGVFSRLPPAAPLWSDQNGPRLVEIRPRNDDPSEA